MSAPRGRGTLATRIMLATTAVAVIAGVLTAFIGAGLIRSSSDRAAKAALHRLANAAQDTARQDDNAQTGQKRVRNQLSALKVAFAIVGPQANVTGANKLARTALTPAEVTAVVAGRSISTTRRVQGTEAFVEARPTPGGGVILVQRRADALGFGAAEQRRLIVAVLIAVAVAVVVGALVAAWLARPLRRTAAATRALAAGHRDVVVQPGGPAEIADVGTAVNQLSASLSHSEGRQRDFLLSVSHDLRTPLTAIRGYAESIADGVVDGAVAQHAGEVILSESQRLQRLVADLLDLARLGAADFRMDFAPVDVTGLLDGIDAAWQPRCGEVGIPLQVQRPGAPLTIVTDAARLRQAVDGLLENALRVVPSGAPIVVTAADDAAGGLVVEVRDGGPGLSDADLAVAFARGALFDRYRGVRSVGTGLGLAIVAGLVERLGGQVSAGHAPEGGARFTIAVPSVPVRPLPSTGPGAAAG